MRFTKFAALSVVLLIIGLIGCTQMMPTEPIEDQDIPLDQIPEQFRNVELKFRIQDWNRSMGSPLGVPLAGYPLGAKAALADSGTITIVSNIFKTNNGLNTRWQARQYSPGTDIRIETLNGRTYNIMVLVNGYPQIGTYAVNGDTLHHFVQLDENQGIFAQIRLVPDDSLGVIMEQGEDNLDQFGVILYEVADQSPPDYQRVEMVGTQTCWSDVFAGMVYNATYHAWQGYLSAIRGQNVKVAFMGNGQLIRHKFAYARSSDMDERVKLDCTELISNPNQTFGEKAPWFTRRNLLDDKRVYRIIYHDDGMIEQGCGGIPFTVRLSVTNNTIPGSYVIMCATSLTNNGEPFQLPRSGGKWQTPNIQMFSGEFWLSTWDATDPNNITPVTKVVKIGSQTLVHLEVDDNGGVFFAGVVYEDGVVVQEEDNRDVVIPGGNP